MWTTPPGTLGLFLLLLLTIRDPAGSWQPRIEGKQVGGQSSRARVSMGQKVKCFPNKMGCEEIPNTPSNQECGRCGHLG